MVTRHEFGELTALIEVVDGPANDLTALLPLFERPDVAESLTAPTASAGVGDAIGEVLEPEVEDRIEDVPSEELLEIHASASGVLHSD